MTTRRVAIFGSAAMLGSAALAEWARPTVRVSDLHPGFKLEELFPGSFGEWRVDENVPVVVPPPDQQAVIDKIYNQTLARTYFNAKGQRVMLSVAYGGDQSDGLTVHIPDVCYATQGFKVEAGRDDRLEVRPGFFIPVRQLVAKMGPRVEPITYWVLMGDEATITATQRRLVSIRYGLRRLIPEGMLVRVSSINPDQAEAIQVHSRFIRELLAQLPEPEHERVVGKINLNRKT
ncbi:exosortase-associated protein EpsI, B-type [Roseateles paludis]|uniref:Exosortase-associated protein EpsI, B-type n=1 Tax=Roseateles paludis TaxID=3145238 RepID=A0ABV0G6Q5_9BURK